MDGTGTRLLSIERSLALDGWRFEGGDCSLCNLHSSL